MLSANIGMMMPKDNTLCTSVRRRISLDVNCISAACEVRPCARQASQEIQKKVHIGRCGFMHWLIVCRVILPTARCLFWVPVFSLLYRDIFLGASVMPWTQQCASLIVCGTPLSTGSLRFGQGKKPGALTTIARRATRPLQLRSGLLCKQGGIATAFCPKTDKPDKTPRSAKTHEMGYFPIKPRT
jgi:hypothetical protein